MEFDDVLRKQNNATGTLKFRRKYTSGIAMTALRYIFLVLSLWEASKRVEIRMSYKIVIFTSG